VNVQHIVNLSRWRRERHPRREPPKIQLCCQTLLKRGPQIRDANATFQPQSLRIAQGKALASTSQESGDVSNWQNLTSKTVIGEWNCSEKKRTRKGRESKFTRVDAAGGTQFISWRCPRKMSEVKSSTWKGAIWGFRY